MHDMGVIDADQRGGHGYEASSRRVVMRLIRAIPDDLSTFTFVDVGSGKGAVLLYAAMFPFQRVVGVEHSAELHSIARDNLRRCAAGQRCENVSSVLMDVLEFPLPSDPLMLYFCNPFEPEVFAAFLARVRRSLDHAPRPMYVLTLNPYRSVLDGQPSARRIGGGWASSAYRLDGRSSEN